MQLESFIHSLVKGIVMGNHRRTASGEVVVQVTMQIPVAVAEKLDEHLVKKSALARDLLIEHVRKTYGVA